MFNKYEKRNCEYCGKLFLPTRKNNRFCSPACYKKLHKINNIERYRENNKRWKQEHREIVNERAKNNYKNYVKNLRDKIEKQQEEIEENNKYTIKLTDEQYNKVINAVHNEWKDKIKAKIKEWDVSIKWANADDRYYCIKILKELLGEENE